MQHDFAVRIANRGDLKALINIYPQLQPDDPALALDDAERIWEQISHYPGSGIFVGLVSDILVSTCTLIVVPNLTRGGAPYGLIENVVTHAFHRRQGYGQAVLRAAIASAWNSRCYKVMLLTGSKEPTTLKFYRDVGFEQNKTGFQIRQIPARA
ncbi:acetyltransferase GNAT family protein [Variibacter gotjawalensis]|uniref:Acetyltransferase GNAT family protein n=1 Tax=Variibacter gotjawalensis TaxID=1333996 RepID=A0A0S3PPR7_9BRAD|nr:GNAT family N-acetyltransferase [Variibacter gotjawalensis]NIK48222.1 GNAT superfamily N-acetyltransferase [Variibacter gotjawalensis]RZS50094.1 acetyltransferase (GNAT) family protein [Variibacter gotjawalensis]BAT57924.1 acetyltransferase GNAT family protein [Variibacter gotjawalensis]